MLCGILLKIIEQLARMLDAFTFGEVKSTVQSPLGFLFKMWITLGEALFWLQLSCVLIVNFYRIRQVDIKVHMEEQTCRNGWKT